MTNEKNALSWLVKLGIDWMGKGRLAKVSGRLHLPGLQSRVEVIRDRWGVPHIYADNENDLFFTQGFVHAQDRFWQMEFQRRMVAGRLSELLGEDGLEVDRWMRVLGMYLTAEQEAEQVSGESRQMLNAYCSGVNAWLKFRHMPVELTLLRSEPEPWRVADSLAWSKMMAWMLSANWEAELLRKQITEKLGAERVAQLDLENEESWPVILSLPNVLDLEQNPARQARPLSGPDASDGVGSNNWVLSGARTSTGKPLLANDMHLLLSTPAIWYENHLVAGDLNVTGVSLPGLPMIIVGHNEKVAWGFTAGLADVQDLYEEHLHRTPDGGVEYEYQGAWYPAEVRQEEIRVRNRKPVVEEVIVTRHGPIITPLFGENGPFPGMPPLALCWTAAETSGGTLMAMNRASRAHDCFSFRESMRNWNVPVLNAVYADVDGNIAYSLVGKIPIRARGEGKVPVQGWTGAYDWTGFVPFDENPHLYNPSSGFIVTANNQTAGSEYPYYIARDYVTGDRAERITELILKQPKIDLGYVRQMQFDQVSPSARTLAQVIGQLPVEGPVLMDVVERMRTWEGVLSVDSPEATIYEALMRQLLSLLFERHLEELTPRFAGEILNELNTNNLWGQHAWEWLRQEITRPASPWFNLGGGETRDDILRLALQRTVDFLQEELGPEIGQWTWGHFHTFNFQHMLGRVKPLDAIFNRGPYPVGGDNNTIWATGTVMDKLDAGDGMVGPPFRFIADLSDLNHTLGQLAPGQSGQVGSPHYDDQVEAWFKGDYHPMWYQREEVLREQADRLVLFP